MEKIILFIRQQWIFQVIFNIFHFIGYNFIVCMQAVGRFCIFLYKNFLALFHKKFFFKNFLNLCYVNGLCSVPVVSLTGLFSGAVLTLQLFISLSSFGINDQVPYIVLLALTKELCPVICGLIIISRVGSSMSAEIGSMACNNQIDVLTSMSINKYSFLYVPRILSTTILQPLLNTISLISGLIGGYFIATHIYGYTDTYFFTILYQGFDMHNYMVCIVKGLFFGLIISSIACYKGNKTKDGAVGIKNTTISTVVLSSVYILIANFCITFAMQ